MGFLDFMATTKKKGDLDIPPLPAFPMLSDGQAAASFPKPAEPMPQAPQSSAPNFKYFQAQNDYSKGIPSFVDIQNSARAVFQEQQPQELQELNLPELPEIEKEEREIEMLNEKLSIKKQMNQAFDIEVPEHIPSFSDLRDEVRMIRPKPIFIKTEQFKQLTGNLAVLKDSARDFEETFVNFIETGNQKEKQVEKIGAVLDDIQRKLIRIDNALFER